MQSGRRCIWKFKKTNRALFTVHDKRDQLLIEIRSAFADSEDKLGHVNASDCSRQGNGENIIIY